jgi:hypothetical protein
MMAHQVREFQVTIPKGTPIAAPVTVDVSFPPFTVVSVAARIPPGPLGQMGFRVASSRQQVIPWNPGSWIVANDDRLQWQADNYPTSGDWQIIGYNTGAFDHTIYVTFELDPVGFDTAPVVTVTPADLSTITAPEPVTP